jgi:membrane protein
MLMIKAWSNWLREEAWLSKIEGRVLYDGYAFLKALLLKIKQDDCQGLASEMAYHFILAIIPAFIFLFSLFGMIGRVNDLLPLVMQTLSRLAPPHTLELLQQTVYGVFEGSSGQLTIIGFGVAIWSAAGGASVVIKGLHRAYGIPETEQPFWYGSLISLLILLSLGGMTLVASSLILFGNHVMHLLEVKFALPLNMLLLINSVRWTIIIGGLVFFSAFVYALVLRRIRKRLEWKAALWGSVVFVMLWIVISNLFGLYVGNIREFNPFYGTLGAVVLLMTWLYLSSLSILIGGEVTALLVLSPRPFRKTLSNPRV